MFDLFPYRQGRKRVFPHTHLASIQARHNLSKQAERRPETVLLALMEVTQKKRSLPSNFSCPPTYATMDVSTETLKAESRFTLKTDSYDKDDQEHQA